MKVRITTSGTARRHVFGLCLLASLAASATASAQSLRGKNVIGAPSDVGGAFLLRGYGLALPGADVTGMRVDMGLVLRPLPHLAFDAGLGAGGGSMRRLSGSDSYFEMGTFLDVRVFANPGDRVQAFALAGAGVGSASATQQTRPVAPDEECPGDVMFFADLSVGGGLEWNVSRHLGFTAWGRAQYRTRLLGDLTFVEARVNPPFEASNSAWGFAAGINMLVYMRP